MARSIEILLAVLLLSGCSDKIQKNDLTIKQKAMFVCVDLCAAIINVLPPHCSKEEYMCKDLKYVACYMNVCGCAYPVQELNCSGASIYQWKLKQ